MFKLKINASIDIGASSIKGVILKNGKVNQVSKVDLNPGTIVSGNIEDFISFGDKLREITESLKLKNKNIVVSLPIQDFFVKFLSIPILDEKEKNALIETELEDLIPNYDGEEFLTNYISLKLGTEAEEIIAITIKKSRIENLLELFDSLKIVVLKIVPDFVSVYNFLQKQKEKDAVEAEESVMVVDVGAEATKIFIEKNGFIKLQRIVAIGGNEINTAIENIFHLDYENAEKMKKSLELADDSFSSSADPKDQQLFMEIADVIKQLEKQLRVSSEFYISHERVPGIDKIYFTGGTTLLKGFKYVIQSQLEVEVLGFSYVGYLTGSENSVETELCASLLGNIIEEVK